MAGYNANSFYAAGAHTQVTADTAQVLTAPAGAQGVIIQANGGVRYTVDGTTPTASLGFRIDATSGERLIYLMGTSLRIINESAGTVTDYQFVGGL